MADGGGSSRVSTVGDFPPADDPNPLKTLYPMVNEEETPLPRTWSNKDKYKFIGLSQNNLRVHYKGPGNEIHNAACVRATHPIPAACGLYYYEIKIVSNVCNGYMAVGLSLQGTNMNRLPGWDQNTFGYHGDDGYRFGESPAGMPYGPTFSTGDVIGCGVNLVDRSCFFTKNGVLLGTAFKDLSKDLYPTVGLQSNGAVLDTNFGTSGPFVYDLRYKLQEVRESVRRAILSHLDDKGLGDPCSSMIGGSLSTGSSALVGAAAWDKGKWTDILNKMVSGYLVHHGYCSTAEAFSRATNMEDFNEEITSIKNRQRISGLVMAGDVGGSIAAVEELYPTLLRDNPNLHFQLKVRQFIEIVKGTEQHGGDGSATSHGCTINGVTVANGTADSSAVLQGKIPKHTSVIQSTKSVLSSNKSSSREASPPQLARTEEQLNERNAAGVVSQASQLMAPLLAAEQQQRSSAGPSSALLSRSGGDSGRNSPRHLSRQGSSSPTISAVVPAQQGLGGSSTATSSLILLRQEQESSSAGVPPPAPADSDTEMDCLDESENVAAAQAVAAAIDGSGQSSSSSNSSNSRHPEGGSSMNGVSNGFNRHTGEEDMIVDDDTTRLEFQRNGALNAGEARADSPAPSACIPFTASSQLNGEGVNGSRRRSQVEKVLSFGRELQALSQLLRRTHGKNRNNKRMLQDAFSLLAYNDPSSSPMGWQLDTKQREPVCQALNSAILEAQNLPARPALEVCASHTQQLVNLMSRSGLGAAAFTQINSILHFNPKPFVAENTYAMPPGGGDQFSSPAMEQEDGVASSHGIAKDSVASWFRKFGSPAKDDGTERLTSKPGGSGGSRKSSVGGTSSSRLNRSQRASPNGSSSSSGASSSGKRSSSNNFRQLPTDNPSGGVSLSGGIVSGVFSAASGGSSGQGGSLTAASITTTTPSSAASRVSSVIAPNSSGGTLLESSSSSSCSNISRLLSSSNVNTEEGLLIGGNTRNASSLPPGPAFITASSLSTSAGNVPSSSTPPDSSGYRDHLNGDSGVRYDSREEEERPMDESGSGFGSSSSLYLGSGGGGYHTAYEEDFILETIGTFDFPAQSGSNDGSSSSATPPATTTTTTALSSSLATEGGGGGGSSSLGAGAVPGASGSDGDFYYDYMSGGSNSAGIDPTRRHDTAAATTNGSSSSSTTSSSVTITGNIFGGISGGGSTIVGVVETTAAASTGGVGESSSSSSASNSSSSHNTPTLKPSTRRRRRRQERSSHRDGSDESDDDEPMAMDDVEDAAELPPPPPRRSSPSPSVASAAGATSISSTTSSSSSSSSGASAAAAAPSSSASSQQQGSEDAAMVTEGAWPPNTRQ